MVNKLAYRVSNYNSREELWDVITTQQKLLAEQNCVSVLYKSGLDNNLYILEFSSNELFDVDYLPMWLNKEEMQLILNYRGEDDTPITVKGNMGGSDSGTSA